MTVSCMQTVYPDARGKSGHEISSTLVWLSFW